MRLILLFAFFPITVFAQKDTVYFSGLKQTLSQQEASHYRLPYIKDGEKYKVLEYYIGGEIKTEGYSNIYDSLVWDGPYTSYHKNGKKEHTGNYANGHKIGNWKQYQDDGKLWVLTSHNLISDTAKILRSFYKSGKVKRIEYHLKGKDPKGICYNEDGAEIKYTPFEKMPEFKGDVNVFLAKTIRYPNAAMEHELEGKVLVQFTVLEDGKVTDVKVVNPSIDPVLMLEAVRVVKLSSGMWKPGMQDDVTVKVYFTLPVVFRLE
jgi:TonB family protein